MISQTDGVVSLFSGAGGFSYGFALAGLKPLFGAELDKDACKTYEANVGNSCHNVDLSEISPRLFTKLLNGKAPFAIIGGPPCQGFSTAGSRNAEDPRNRLIFNYIHIVREVRPRWFIFENVEGLLTSNHGDAVASLVREFLHIGYSIRLEKVNLAGYGVPQTRKRVLIIGNRIGADFRFPEEIYSYDSGKAKKLTDNPFAPTLNEAIGSLDRPATNRADRIGYVQPLPLSRYDEMMRNGNCANTFTEHFDNTDVDDAYLYSLLASGQTMKDLPEKFWHKSFKRRAFRRVMDGTPTEKRGGPPSGIKRLRGDLQSLTITGASCREFIHPSEDRPLTVRECARIQSFPDRYEFWGNAASVMQQIGNAVPPIAASLFAAHLQRLDGLYGSGLQTLPTISSPKLLGYKLTESSGMSEALKKTESKLKAIMHPNLELEVECV